MRIVFSEKAERFSFAVALASCLAKYARESAMAAFNAYFRAHAPALAPTAGYATDARRWLADAEEVLGRLGLERAQFVRAR
jgi:ribonuclease HII